MPAIFAVTPTSTTVLGTNQFPVSAVFVPGTASGNLTALQGGPASTDGNGYASAPMAVYQATGSNLHVVVDSGSITDSGTVTASQGGSWTVQSNAGTNLNTSALALESGGNLAAILAALDDGQEAMANSLSVAIASDQSAVPVSGTFWQVTQPVSAASLPLPAGASTSAKQPALGTAGTASSDVITVQGIASMTAVKVDGSAVTQPVSGSVTANIGTTSGLALDTTVAKLNVAQSAALGSNTGPMMQGSVTTNAPSYATGTINPLSLDTSGLLRVSLKDTPANTNTFNVALAASSATVTVAGTVTANQGGAPWSGNITEFGGTTIATGTGASGNGIPRVTVSNDSNVLATQSGTWTVQPGNTPNTSAWLVQDVAGTTGGATTTHLVSASGNNATNVKASAGLLYGFSISNTSAAARYVHFYNKATAPSVGTDVPVATVQVPGNGVVIRAFPVGATYGTGIGFGTSTGAGDTDSGSVGAGDLVIDLEYK